MKDRYLFKAKRIDNGEWIIGYLYRISENHHPFIMLENRYGESCEVDEHTICQCTGLKDKNGELIWENDIVEDEKGNLYKAFGETSIISFLGFVLTQTYSKSVQNGICMQGEVLK